MSTVEELKAFTEKKLEAILMSPSENRVRASLARLRHGVGHAPGELPELWGEFLLELPENLMGHGEPSAAEWAIYIALTMFALHQQGKDRKASPMHRRGNSLGTAARCLIENEEDRERVARRFYPIAVASDMSALSHHLRSLISLLRAEDIPLDYVRLAADLYYFQNPKTADRFDSAGVRISAG